MENRHRSDPGSCSGSCCFIKRNFLSFLEYREQQTQTTSQTTTRVSTHVDQEEEEQSQREHTQEPQRKMKEWRTPRKKWKWRRDIMSGSKRRTRRRSRACTSDKRIRAMHEADESDEHEKRTTRDTINATTGVHDEASPPKLGGGRDAW